MKIDSLPDSDGGADFDKVELVVPNNLEKEYPYCKEHGAMNKVASHKDGGGIWRCVTLPKGAGLNTDCRAGCIELGDE